MRAGARVGCSTPGGKNRMVIGDTSAVRAYCAHICCWNPNCTRMKTITFWEHHKRQCTETRFIIVIITTFF